LVLTPDISARITAIDTKIHPPEHAAGLLHQKE
jgi:hypothetical protein